jgi:hypothetical protein
MNINTNKTEVMTISKDRHVTNITINGNQLKQIEEFKYLRNMLTYNKKEIDIGSRHWMLEQL